MFADHEPATGLLLAAHGERNDGAVNAGMVRLAATLRSRGVAAEVAIGFIKGQPSVDAAMRALRCKHVLVYPLFLSAGYFTRVRLPQLLECSLGREHQRNVHILPPLGLAPALAGVIARRLLAAAWRSAIAPKEACVVLLAHGSTTDPASRIAAEKVAAKVQRPGLFRNVRAALLEESPTLTEVVSHLSPPILVFGLFAGDGLHGGGDAPRLVEELGRTGVVFAGTLADLDGVADVVAASLARMMKRKRVAPRNNLRSSHSMTQVLTQAPP
jgi:sirohydrochlorin cobaltochelatase